MQALGRWSNSGTLGKGYLALGLSGGNADHVFWSYSTVQIWAGAFLCSGTFIGPNVLLTAGHCGHFADHFLTHTRSGEFTEPPKESRRFRAFLYPEGSEDADQGLINSFCETLVQNIGNGDTHLVYCDNVPRGITSVPPGELLGMADFDLGNLSLGQPVWTSWQNPECPGWTGPADQCPGPRQMFFSPGNVDSINPGALYGADALKTSQIFTGGSSGGGVWRQTAGSHHRLVSSGLSNGPHFVGQAGASGSNVATIVSALSVADAWPGPEGYNEQLLLDPAIGLAGPGTPWTVADYQGKMDRDGDRFFDVQARLDDLRGIPLGPTIWLGFESPRRNRMWITNPAANPIFRDVDQFVRLDYSGPGDEVVLEMPKVHFRGGQFYRISAMVYADASSEPKGLAVELWDAGGSAPVARWDLETPATANWEMVAAEIKPTAPEQRVRIRVTGTDFHGSIANLTFQQGTANRFDTFSERLNWRNDTTGGRAWIVPYGHSFPYTEVDWAGVVNDQTSDAVDWSLRSRQLAIEPTKADRVCFQVRSFPLGAGSGDGRVLLGDGSSSAPPGDDPLQENTVYIDDKFTFSDTWQQVCTSGVQAQAGDNLLKFGHLEGEPEYLVDDVLVQPL